MTEEKKPCLCSDKCNNFGGCKGPPPKIKVVDISLEDFERCIDSAIPKPSFVKAFADNHDPRHCFFCNKTTPTQNESCVVCGLSKTNKE